MALKSFLWIGICGVIIAATALADDDVDAEIIVEGELRVLQARRAVEHELKTLGYTPKKRKKDYILFRHPQNWKGEIRLYDDGWVRMKRQPVQFQVPKIPALGKGAPAGVILCLISPSACIRAGGQLVSRQKFMGQKVRTLEDIRPEVARFTDAVVDFNIDQTVDELPLHLENLWDNGVSLNATEGPRLNIDERKAALFSYWDSRTENRWGMRVRASIEIFIREVVQYSAYPFSELEIQVLNQARKSKAALDLERPWTEVNRQMETESPKP